MKKLYLLIFLITFLSAKDSLKTQQKNVLYVQNLIKREESIAKEPEKYILENFKIPTLEELKTDTYLGVNFPLENKMGDTLGFKDSSKLQLKYAITKSFKNYVSQLYKRDLYRDKTSVSPSSYTQILLKSKEAKNLYKIIKNAGTTLKKDDCTTETSLKSSYCIDNKREDIIRYFDANSKWIDYDKKEFENGNVTVNDINITNLSNLSVGVFIYTSANETYIKTMTKILKVE